MTNERSDEFTFIWKIENFSFCNKKNGEVLKSPTFLVNSLNQSKWKLWLYPKGNSKDSENYVSLFLNNIYLSIENITLYLKFELIRADGIILLSVIIPSRTFKKNDNLGFRQFLPIGQLDSIIISSKDTLTLSCHMKMLDDKHPTRCEAYTKIFVDRLTVQWNVPYSNSSEWSDHKIFRIAESSAVDVVLTIPNDEILISIKKINEQIFSPGVVKCKFALLTVDEIEDDSKTDSHFFTTEEDVWKFSPFIRKSEINSKKDKLLKDGVFTLQIELSISNGKCLEEIEKYEIDDLKSSNATILDSNSLCDDYINLYNSKKHSDIELKVSGTIFPAHKTVLVARSKKFSNMSETQNGVVEIKDIDEETFKLFLNFMYTNRIEKMGYEAAIKLLQAANEYEVLSLVEKCGLFLISSFTNENVCEILVVADMMEHKKLKDSAINFIKKNSKQITNTSKWYQWVVNNFELSKEVFSELSNG